MSDKPILFSGPMVRALLAGTKTQTRRALKEPDDGSSWYRNPSDGLIYNSMGGPLPKVRIQVGDRLYVREHWRVSKEFNDHAPAHSREGRPILPPGILVHYIADGTSTDRLAMLEAMSGKFRQGMHMPRWASRITLHVTEVRVQRLGDISDEDAKSEGIVFTDFGQYTSPGTMSIDGGATFHPLKPRQHEGWHWGEVSGPSECLGSPVSAYANLWGHINGPGSWEANPWVAAYTFTVERANIDASLQPTADGFACTPLGREARR